MQIAHLEELIALEQTYWWHVTKRAIATDILNRFCPSSCNLFEGGVGGGTNLMLWQNDGYIVSGCDLLKEAVEHCHSIGLKGVYLQDLRDEWKEPPASKDVVILLDVLEHVEDPVRVLKQASKVLKHNGIIIINVPALPWLFGPWDEILGHHRRYSLALLHAHAHKAGLEIIWRSHWNLFALPIAIITRLGEKISRKRKSAEFPRVNSTINRILIYCGKIERGVMRLLPIPIGLSLVAVLRQKEIHHETGLS